jgi:hypothetical protein
MPRGYPQTENTGANLNGIVVGLKQKRPDPIGLSEGNRMRPGELLLLGAGVVTFFISLAITCVFLSSDCRRTLRRPSRVILLLVLAFTVLYTVAIVMSWFTF